MSRVRRVVEGCGFLTLADMDGEKVVDWLNEFREEEDIGARTYNHYLQAADAFGKWLAATKRLPGNPLVGMGRLNAETDVRHRRRALKPTSSPGWSRPRGSPVARCRATAAS